jgi:glycosyl transferase, family 25
LVGVLFGMFGSGSDKAIIYFVKTQTIFYKRFLLACLLCGIKSLNGFTQIQTMNYSVINSYFDKIYVITLRRATERHVQLQQHLQGLNYTLWYGTDMQDIDVAALEKSGSYSLSLSRKHHVMKKEMKPGEIGCALSHLMIYQDVLKNQYSRVLILEDDAVIDIMQIHLFENMVQELPPNWQLWYLGFNKNEKPPAIATLKKAFYHVCYALGIKRTFNHTAIRHLYPRPYSAHLMAAGFHDCTHAYAITASAAAVLLHMQTPLQYVADNLLAFAATEKKLNAFVSWPRLINQPFQLGDGNNSYVQVNESR